MPDVLEFRVQVSKFRQSYTPHQVTTMEVSGPDIYPAMGMV